MYSKIQGCCIALIPSMYSKLSYILLYIEEPKHPPHPPLKLLAL